MIAELLVLAGALLTLSAAIGAVRMRDVLVRMHSLSKASTLGVLLALGGAAIHLDDPNDVTSLVLAAVLQVVTGPVAANATGRAAWRATPRPDEPDAAQER